MQLYQIGVGCKDEKIVQKGKDPDQCCSSRTCSRAMQLLDKKDQSSRSSISSLGHRSLVGAERLDMARLLDIICQ